MTRWCYARTSQYTMLTGGTLLTNLNLIVAVEARFNFKLNNGEIDESENVGDLVQIIVARSPA